MFTELFRAEWMPADEARFVQWNVVHSDANVLRGFHAHHRHDDYLTVASGRVIFGLKDLRPSSVTHGMAATVEISAEQPMALLIPHGVGHGFYFVEPSIHVYAVSNYWDKNDELGCKWDDPGLGIDWPCDAPLISEHDAELPPLATLIEQLAANGVS